MGLRSFISKAAAKMGYYPLPEGVAAGAGSWYWSGFSDLGVPANQVAAYQGWVSTATNLISTDMARLPRKLYKRQGTIREEWQEILEHPLLDLINRPNPLMTGTQVLKLRQLHLDLTGMAFWYAPRNGLGLPAEIWPLLPHMLVKIETENNDPAKIKGFRFRDDLGKETVYAWEDVVYFRYPHPKSLLYGASPIQQQALAYDTDEALRKYQRAFLANSARPDYVLSSDGALTDDTVKRIKTRLKQDHGGPDRVGEPMIMSNGLKPVPLSFSAKDFEFMALAGWTRDNLLAAYGVPAAKLGLVEDVNRANGSEADITYRRECIGPRAEAASEDVTYQLASRYDPKLWLEFENHVPDDENAAHARKMAELDHGLITVNEWRDEEGLPSLEGGDVPHIPSNMVPLAMSVDLGDKGAPAEEQLAAAAPVVKDSAASLEFIAKLRPWEERMRSMLVPFFQRQHELVRVRLADLWPKLEGKYAGWAAAKVVKFSREDLDPIFAAWEAQGVQLGGVWQTFMPAVAMEAGAEALAFAESGIAFNLVDRRVVDWLASHGATAAKVNEYTRTRLQDALSKSLAQGDALKDATERVSEIFDWCQNARARTIARTEIANARRWAYDEGLVQSGVAFLKRWVNEPGARPSHQAAGRRYTRDNAIPQDEPFHVGSCEALVPGHSGCAREDINCRCHVMYDVDRSKSAGPAHEPIVPVSRAYSLEECHAAHD